MIVTILGLVLAYKIPKFYDEIRMYFELKCQSYAFMCALLLFIMVHFIFDQFLEVGGWVFKKIKKWFQKNLDQKKYLKKKKILPRFFEFMISFAVLTNIIFYVATISTTTVNWFVFCFFFEEFKALLLKKLCK